MSGPNAPRAHEKARPPVRRVALIAAAGVATLAAVAADAARPDTSRTLSDEMRSPVHRSLAAKDPSRVPQRSKGAPVAPAIFPEEVRSIDGTGNHVGEPLWGVAGTPMRRAIAPAYADGAGAPNGTNRRSPREISNLALHQDSDRPNPVGVSDWIWQWGQFLDHDITETPLATPREHFDIPVPAGDPWFDPQGTGRRTIPLSRSAGEMIDGARQQFNNITSYVDGSNVYGSEEERTHALRTNDGTGRLATSAGDLMPFNVQGLPNGPDPTDPGFFLAGDIRGNEQTALIAIHTVFVREHNRLAGEIAAADPSLDGETIFERARAIVGAQLQAITWNEFLPRLLGPDAMPPYAGWRPEADPRIDNVFATAAFRMGHTMLSETVLRVGPDGEEAPEGHLPLASSFFRPSEVIDHGIDSILRGLAHQRAQTLDLMLVDAVRNMLFGPPGAGGFDLASLNIQRGRDHGLPSYNAIREAYGRPRAESFSAINPDPGVVARLAAAYDHPDDIDAWVGLLAEPLRPGGCVGETLMRVLRDQFVRLRDGDRFWYQTYLPAEMAAAVEADTLATIIRRNTGIGAELPDDVFIAAGPAPCAGDLTGDRRVDLADLLALLGDWGMCAGCPSDLDGDGTTGIGDLLVLVAGWGDC